MGGYDETVISDMLNVHGASLSPLVGQLRYLVLVYAIFVVFLNAGILGCIVKNEMGWKPFWKNGAEYFFRFLKTAIFFVVLTFIWAGIVWGPFISFFPTSPEVLSSEKISVFMLFGVALIFLFGLFFLFNWSVISRIKIIDENMRTWKAIRSALRFSVKKYLSLTGLFLLFFFLQILLAGIYWLVEDASGMVTPILILVFFLFQQIFIFSRIIFRLMMYAGVWVYWEGQESAER